MDNIIENDFDDIIDNIFLNSPKDSKSIQLVFDDINTDELLFKKLVEILVKGMKILFSNGNETVNIQELTDDDFYKIKMYFRSFGFDVIYNINQQPSIESKNDNELSLYYFSLKITDDMIYYIVFDYI
jgi:hypothetical protein